MSKLSWDQVSERFYETGIDRGVLYLPDGSGVSWSGLTGVQEDFGDDGATANYFDGIKTSDTLSFGDFSASLTALTYPDDFLEFEGVGDLGNGLYVDDQAPKMFGLSYRTLVGNDVERSDFGYKIHILYNLTAVLDSSSHETLSDSPEAMEFSWKLSSVPQGVTGYRPTAHIILDSTELGDNALITGFEDILYGTDNTDPRLLTINDFIDFAGAWDPRLIVPDLVGGLANLEPGLGDLTPGTIDGLYVALPRTRLRDTDVDGVYQLSEN